MTEKRFHWDWKTGRMKDTYSSFQATKNMRLIERQVNDACQSYEKQIAKLKKENEQLKETNQELYDKLQVTMSEKSLKGGEISILKRENERLKQFKECVFDLIDKEIKETKEIFEDGKIDLMTYNDSMIILTGLKEQLKGDDE